MASEGTIPVKTIRVSHLNGTSIGYQLPKPLVGSKITLILIPTFGTNAVVFKPQVTNSELLGAFNLLVFEPLGQGVTKTNSPVWTAWDSAYALIQAMDALNVRKAFVLGESQGGWIAARMALYAPDRVSLINCGHDYLVEIFVATLVRPMLIVHANCLSNRSWASYR